MPCDRVKVGGVTSIVCSRGRRKTCGWCSKPSTLQCDWKLGGGKTCDKFLCADHGEEVAPDKHLCPEHQAAYALWRAARSRAKA